MKKEKVKEIAKKYLIGFILGVVSAYTISVIAATYFPSNQTTYDNTNTELKSENVQDAIDELYGVCFPPKAGDQIIKDAGLEKDPYECRHFFTGANPNNYITFNGEKAGWRIISVECDGTIKIIRTGNIGNMAWGTSYVNNWARPAKLNVYLNGTYYNELNTTAQSQIVAKDWGIGAVTEDNNNLSYQVSAENATKWNGKIALANVSEYIRSNSDKSSCGTFKLNNDNSNSCQNTTWMYINDDWWMLSPAFGETNDSFVVYYYGRIRTNSFHVGESNVVRPSLYLSSEVKITGGDGSQSNPYQLG